MSLNIKQWLSAETSEEVVSNEEHVESHEELEKDGGGEVEATIKPAEAGEEQSVEKDADDNVDAEELTKKEAEEQHEQVNEPADTSVSSEEHDDEAEERTVNVEVEVEVPSASEDEASDEQTVKVEVEVEVPAEPQEDEEDALAVAAEAYADLTVLMHDGEALARINKGLEDYSALLARSIERGEGISGDVATAIQTGLEAMDPMFAEERLVPAVEAFGQTSSTLTATRITAEGLENFMTNALKAAIEWLKKVVAKTIEFVKSYTVGARSVERKADAVVKKADELSKSGAKAEKSEIETKLPKSALVDGKVDVKGGVKLFGDALSKHDGFGFELDEDGEALELMHRKLNAKLPGGVEYKDGKLEAPESSGPTEVKIKVEGLNEVKSAAGTLKTLAGKFESSGFYKKMSNPGFSTKLGQLATQKVTKTDPDFIKGKGQVISNYATLYRMAVSYSNTHLSVLNRMLGEYKVEKKAAE